MELVGAGPDVTEPDGEVGAAPPGVLDTVKTVCVAFKQLVSPAVTQVWGSVREYTPCASKTLTWSHDERSGLTTGTLRVVNSDTVLRV